MLGSSVRPQQFSGSPNVYSFHQSTNHPFSNFTSATHKHYPCCSILLRSSNNPPTHPFSNLTSSIHPATHKHCPFPTASYCHVHLERYLVSPTSRSRCGFHSQKHTICYSSNWIGRGGSPHYIPVSCAECAITQVLRPPKVAGLACSAWSVRPSMYNLKPCFININPPSLAPCRRPKNPPASFPPNSLC